MLQARRAEPREELMKYFRILGPLLVAVAAMMAFAASASADYVSTTTNGAAATPNVHAVNGGGHVTLKTDSGIVISCSSTVEGEVDSHGSGIKASGAIDHLTFTSCTNFWHVTTITPGTLSVEHKASVGGREHDGTVFSSGAGVHATRLGINCVFETKTTDIGTLTAGNTAILDVSANVLINPNLSSPVCGTTPIWEGQYVTTQALFVHNS